MTSTCIPGIFNSAKQSKAVLQTYYSDMAIFLEYGYGILEILGYINPENCMNVYL